MDDILRKIKEHYRESNSVLVASSFGKLLTDCEIWPIEGEERGLIDYLDSLSDDVKIERDGAYVLISDTDNHQKIIDAIRRRTAAKFLRQIPKSVLIAFSIRTPPDEKIYVQSESPFKYSIGVTAPAYGKFTELADADRRPGLVVHVLHELSLDALVDLEEKIRKWMLREGISESDLKVREDQQSVGVPVGPSSKSKSAIERLIEAQPSELRDRLVIPADIALLLSRN